MPFRPHCNRATTLQLRWQWRWRTYHCIKGTTYTLVLRSEWEDLLDKAQDDVIDGKIRSLDDAKANPIVPNQFVLFAAESIDDSAPGAKKSVATLSKSITVRLCKQTEYTARLETKSRRMLRQMRHMYNDIASHTKDDKDDLVGYDCSKFPWFKHMLPAPARP
jgi:hypothetical protein